MQRILGYMRKAIDDYNMISDGDRIAVGLSGVLKICKDFIQRNLN